MAEQETLKQDLDTRAVEERMSHEPGQVRRGRSFDRGESERERREGIAHDLDDDEGLHNTLDDEDDARGIATAMPH